MGTPGVPPPPACHYLSRDRLPPWLRVAQWLSRVLRLAGQLPPQQLLTANHDSQIQFSHKENLIISIKKTHLPFREPKQDALLQLVWTPIGILPTAVSPVWKTPGRVPVSPPALHGPRSTGRGAAEHRLGHRCCPSHAGTVLLSRHGSLSPVHAPCGSACHFQQPRPSTLIATLLVLASHSVGKSATLLFLSNAHQHPASVSCWICLRHQPLWGSVAPGRGDQCWGHNGWQLPQWYSKAKQSHSHISGLTLCPFPLLGSCPGSLPIPATAPGAELPTCGLEAKAQTPCLTRRLLLPSLVCRSVPQPASEVGKPQTAHKHTWGSGHLFSKQPREQFQPAVAKGSMKLYIPKPGHQRVLSFLYAGNGRRLSMKITQKDYFIQDQILTKDWHHCMAKPEMQCDKPWHASL